MGGAAMQAAVGAGAAVVVACGILLRLVAMTRVVRVREPRRPGGA